MARTALPIALSLALLSFGLALPLGAQRPAAPTAQTPGADAGADASADAAVPRCNEQQAQPFLIRTNYLRRGGGFDHDAHDRAIRYRTERYGYYEGFGRPQWNPHPPRYYARTVRFFGLTVQMHRRVIPAVQCVEQELLRACASQRYRPRALAGIRFENTYHTGEITNHAFGIALDVDPHRNTCCGCVAPWNQHPLCQRPARTIWDRMAMPECWVQVFERYGFYWLGHDPMHDTMHFEFLGDPDRIVATP